MLQNPVQFAVVREDPWLDRQVVAQFGAKRLLLIASGGCTALSLAAYDPSLEMTLLDPNPAQLGLVQQKVAALSLTQEERNTRFNIENVRPNGLSECGNFESLFRSLRHFLYDLVMPYEEMKRVCRAERAVKDLITSPYWSVAFEMFFCDELLRTMFGGDALQYAKKGTYPQYFQSVFERGLQRADLPENPFMHHLLLGHYLSDYTPDFLRSPAPKRPFKQIEGFIDEQVNLAEYDFIGLSNIMDWMKPEDRDALRRKIQDETTIGTVIMWRQLNNEQPLMDDLLSTFVCDPSLNDRLLLQDRSLFYNRVNVLWRTA